MAVIKRICEHYTNRLKEYEDEIKNAIKAILGNEFVALYDTCKDTFTPAFMASKDGIEYYLGGTITDEERKVLEYLKETMEDKQENEQFIFLDESIRKSFNATWDDFFRDSKVIKAHYNRGNGYNSWAIGKIDILSELRDGLFLDYTYIYILICHLVDNYCVKTKTEPISDKEFEMWRLILKSVSLQIVALLRNKDVFILDRDDEYNEELVRDKYILLSPSFIEKTSHLFTRLLLRPNELKKQIGEIDFGKLIEAGLNGDDLELELYEKLKSIPSVEFSYLFCKNIFSKDKFGLNDLKLFSDAIRAQIDEFGDNGICAIFRRSQLLEDEEGFIQNVDNSFANAVVNIFENLLLEKKDVDLKEIDSAFLIAYLYRLFCLFIDIINNRNHRKLDNHNIFILELHNFSPDDGKNYPNYVLLFDIDGEYYVCDGYSYLFAIMKYWENMFEINSEDLAKFRSDAEKYLMMPLSNYLEREKYYSVSGNPTIDGYNFSVVSNGDESVVYMLYGLTDEQMCKEIPSMSLKRFLEDKKQKKS